MLRAKYHLHVRYICVKDVQRAFCVGIACFIHAILRVVNAQSSSLLL